MKILILAENLEINRTSSGLRSQKHLIVYQKICQNIDVVKSTPDHLMYKLSGINYHHVEEISIDKYEWINKIPKLGALQNYLFGLGLKNYYQIKKWTLKTEYLLNKNKYDLVVSLGSGASFITAYALYYLKKKVDFKHLMFVHDPFPLNQYPPPMKKKDSLPYKSIAKLFGKVVESADIVSFPSLKLMEWMSNYYPHIKKKYIIQPHIGMSQAELKPFLPKQQNFEIPLFSKGLNIVHTGSLLSLRSPNYIIKALQMLFKNKPDSKQIVKLHIIGKINKVWNLDELTSDNVFVSSKRYTYLESLQIQQKAEVLLLIEPVSVISPIMVGKLADYLVARKPILALTPKNSETSRILGEDYKILAENGKENEIYSKLELLYNAYLNNSLDDLIPSIKAVNYVSSEKWLNKLKKLKQNNFNL
mgnify:CR=1 FL=1